MKKQPQKSQEELIREHLAMAKKSLAESNRILAISNKVIEESNKQLKAMAKKMAEDEKRKLEEDRNNAHLDNYCKSCDKYRSCQKLKYRISERLNTCVLLRFDRDHSNITPSVLLPENYQTWTSLLNSFLQYHTQFDSGLSDIASTPKYHSDSDRNRIELRNFSKSQLN